MPLVPTDAIARIEELIRRDPGRRGLIGADGTGPGGGSLYSAAVELAQQATHVALVTGFFIPDAPPESGTGNAETDGPPGTCLLARVLQDLGASVRILTDSNCVDVVTAAAEAFEFDSTSVLEVPLASGEWRQSFLQSAFGRRLSHLIAVERVGPNHTADSVAAHAPGEAVREFEDHVPHEARDVCCNMRGDCIDEHTGDLHQLFEEVGDDRHSNERPPLTIGIGDGGNEIGMGRFGWHELKSRLPGESAARVPCRIATDHTIVAGTSNWGAQALAAAVCVLRNRIDVLERHTEVAQEQQLQFIVGTAGAVDGVTRLQEPTVDGLPFLTYIQPWTGIRDILEMRP